MPDLRSKTVHQREVTCFLSSAEVIRLIQDHALRAAGYEPGAENVTVRVRLEDETAGSPSYKVGTKARVDIVEVLGGEG